MMKLLYYGIGLDSITNLRLAWAALATGNLIVTLVIAALMFAAYAYRIQAEEAMLVATLGQPYGDYQAQTKRLKPFVY